MERLKNKSFQVNFGKFYFCYIAKAKRVLRDDFIL